MQKINLRAILSPSVFTVAPDAPALSTRGEYRQWYGQRCRSAGTLENTSIPPHLLELELTESMRMNEPERAIDTMNKLKQAV
jgi:hypothetical protein